LYYVFVRFIGFCPVGSLCLLNTGEKGIIFRPSGEKLGVPLMKILADEKDSGADAPRGKLIDLAHFPETKIVKVLDPKREGLHLAGYFFE